MKRSFFFALIALAAVSWGCSKETAPEIENPEVPQTVLGTHVASLSVGAESDPTKGIFVDDRTFQWQAGDQIGVYLYSSTLTNVAGSYGVSGQYGPWIAPFYIQSGAGTGTAVFTRNLNDELGETVGNVAIYPYTSGTSYLFVDDDTRGTLTFHLPDKYENLDDLNMVRIPMVGELDMTPGGDKTSVNLKHVGGDVKFTLLNVPSKAKYFKLWAVGKNISGDYTIQLNQVGSGTLQGNGSGNTVELQLKEGRAAEELTVYFPVPAGTYQLGIGVYGDGIVYLEKTASRENTVGRGQILRMPAVTIPEPYLGAYDENLPVADKASGLTYQVNVYSFADSDGDGVGDFKGIEDHLDYFDKLGVTALWLSPSQKAQSYHGYDVTDYSSLNPKYGDDAAFRSLIQKAHQHNIRIYMDYVINHTGDQHPWFQDVKKNGPASPCWDFFALSQAPWNDVPAGHIKQIPAGSSYNAGEWWPVMTGAGLSVKRYAIDLDWTDASDPTITVSETDEAVTEESVHVNPARYLFWGDGNDTQFADNGTGKYHLVLDYKSDWGCLVRTTDSNDWSSGTKWGFSGMDQLSLGTAHTLYTAANSDDVRNILMPDGVLYYYYSAFYTGAFADLNYEYADNCQNSAAFRAIEGSTDKWLEMGVDGFRLDAVKHIYVSQSDNVTFWKKFYSTVNDKYQSYASSRSDLVGQGDSNVFMVGEVLSNEDECKPYYGGLPAIFEFQFWWELRTALQNKSKGDFVSHLCDRYFRHKEVRSDAISTPKLSNHDEDRTASDLYDRHKIRQAATVLLTSPGRPFIYQGEELGYWGTKQNGDEYVRTPILWTTDHTSAAAGTLSGKVDWDMLSPSISVASQAADKESLLTLYRRFAYARNTNAAMADGWPEYDNKTGDNPSIMAWYMHQNGGEKVCLVMHNISGDSQEVYRWDGENLSTILVASDPIRIEGQKVIMPPYSSVVFALN